ncbi:MAG: hypothetical protein KAH23_08465 [Kiritimatiellae bacterium]|nr:hypothetical protein [Kiritimatiellia bacterium]
MAVRASLACAREYLLGKIETNYLHYAAPPYTTRKIVGWKTNDTYSVRYSVKTVDVPVYKKIYETYSTVGVGKSHSATARKMGKQKKRRVVGRKKVGTRKQKRYTRDPKGSVTKQRAMRSGPIYSKGTEQWRHYLPGENALVMLALLKVGVREDDRRLVPLIDALNKYIMDFGIPDQTWNVAWMAAAFANLRGDRYEKTREQLINRILEGQIADGPSRGMWGPLCINLKLLPALVAHESALGESIKKIEASLKKGSKSESRLEELERLKTAVKDFEDVYKPVTQQGLRFDKVESYFLLKEDPWDEQKRTTPGLPYYFYNQTMADIESTAVALSAIREIAANGYLPKETTVPDLSFGKKGRRGRNSAIRPQNVSGILARATSAIANLQKTTGRWDQGNMHQPCKAFEALGLPPLAKDERVPPLKSQETPMSTAFGYSCLVNAGEAVGIEKLLGRFGRNLFAGRKVWVEDAVTYLDGKAAWPKVLGRILAPYDIYGYDRHSSFSVSGNRGSS